MSSALRMDSIEDLAQAMSHAPRAFAPNLGTACVVMPGGPGGTSCVVMPGSDF